MTKVLDFLISLTTTVKVISSEATLIKWNQNLTKFLRKSLISKNYCTNSANKHYELPLLILGVRINTLRYVLSLLVALSVTYSVLWFLAFTNIIMANNNDSNIDNKNKNIDSILTELLSLPASPFYGQLQTQPPLGNPHSTDPSPTTGSTNSHSTDPLEPTGSRNLFNRMTGTGNNSTTATTVSDSFNPELVAADLSVAPANGTVLKLNGITIYAAPDAQLDANKIGIQFSKEVQAKYSRTEMTEYLKLVTVNQQEKFQLVYVSIKDLKKISLNYSVNKQVKELQRNFRKLDISTTFNIVFPKLDHDGLSTKELDKFKANRVPELKDLFKEYLHVTPT